MPWLLADNDDFYRAIPLDHTHLNLPPGDKGVGVSYKEDPRFIRMLEEMLYSKQFPGCKTMTDVHRFIEYDWMRNRAVEVLPVQIEVLEKSLQIRDYRQACDEVDAFVEEALITYDRAFGVGDDQNLAMVKESTLFYLMNRPETLKSRALYQKWFSDGA